MLSRLVAIASLMFLACGPRPPPKLDSNASSTLLPDLRTAEGRPPVVVVSREGDPAAAIAVAVTTSGLDSDDPEPATALAGLLEARLRAKSVEATVTPSWDGLRASVLATNDTAAQRLADVLREAMTTPVTDAELAGAKKKLAALGQRPLRDRALGRWARCIGQPFALPERAGKDYADLDVARLERWRADAFGLGRVAIAVTGPNALAESVASTVLRGSAWKPGAPLSSTATSPELAVDVFEVAAETPTPAPTVHVTLDVGTSSAAVTTAEALGDPHGPLAARLSELDLPFRLREVVGAAHARGGCVGAVLDAVPTSTTDLAPKVADAIALVQIEAAVHLGEIGGAADGRALARRSGDAREAAERAAWWALVDRGHDTTPCVKGRCSGGSVALGVPSRRGAKDAIAEPSRDALAGAIAAAMTAWDRPVVEARSRVEAGQGELWILFGSPCGSDSETEAEAGLTALVVTATADAVRVTNDARVEPWVATDGAGLLVHGPPLAGETPTAHARRLTDLAARSFAAEPIANASITRARADLLRRDVRGDGPTLSLLATALAPRHPSWIVPWGFGEPLARSSDGSILARAQSLRSGPLRVAVLANADATQADAAVRAADRWVARRTSERACRAAGSATPPKPGTYAVVTKSGALPEAYLAFPFSPGDEAASSAAAVVVAALERDLLERALTGVAHDWSARVLGFPRAPALVVRVAAAQASLDGAVMQVRALVDRLHKGGIADYARADEARGRALTEAGLDPRARIVATWRAETPRSRATAEDLRAFAQRFLTEDTMVVVAARPARPEAPH